MHPILFFVIGSLACSNTFASNRINLKLQKDLFEHSSAGISSNNRNGKPGRSKTDPIPSITDLNVENAAFLAAESRIQNHKEETDDLPYLSLNLTNKISSAQDIREVAKAIVHTGILLREYTHHYLKTYGAKLRDNQKEVVPLFGRIVMRIASGRKFQKNLIVAPKLKVVTLIPKEKLLTL